MKMTLRQHVTTGPSWLDHQACRLTEFQQMGPSFVKLRPTNAQFRHNYRRTKKRWENAERLHTEQP